MISIDFVARHLDCSRVAADTIVTLLAHLGVLIEQTSWSRHKLIVVGDLKAVVHGETGADAPLALSEPALAVDREAVGATLDNLFGELGRLNE